MTEDQAEEILQPVMDRAYAKWPKDTHDFGDFLLSLELQERRVVAISKLNQQVCNGGFSQWRDNGYDHGSDCLLEALRTLLTPAAETTMALVRRALAVDLEPRRNEWGDPREGALDEAYEALNDLDNEFYAVNERLLSDLADYIVADRERGTGT